MQSNLAQALSFILDDEGSEVNIGGSEPGGGSRYGVSLTALADYNRRHGLAAPTLDDIRAMTPELAGKIYTVNFAAPIRFDDLPAGADYRLLDIAVNLGVTGGAIALQLALGLWPLTGAVDDHTIGVIAGMDRVGLIMALSAAWITKKHESPNWNPSPITKTGYGHGWSNRNARATARALSMIGA
jgi:lysozyme family protein